MNRFTLVLLALLGVAIPTYAHACNPCPPTLNVRANQSGGFDVYVNGRRQASSGASYRRSYRYQESHSVQYSRQPGQLPRYAKSHTSQQYSVAPVRAGFVGGYSRVAHGYGAKYKKVLCISQRHWQQIAGTTQCWHASARDNERTPDFYARCGEFEGQRGKRYVFNKLDLVTGKVHPYIWYF